MKPLIRLLALTVALLVSLVSQEAMAAERLGAFGIRDGEQMCRAANVAATRLSYLTPGWSALGAKKNSVDAYVNAVTRWQKHACPEAKDSRVIYDDIAAIGRAWPAIVKDVQKAQDVPLREANERISAQTRYELERLTSFCGSKLEKGFAYIASGEGALNAAAIGTCGKSPKQLRDGAQIATDFVGRGADCYSSHIAEQSRCGSFAMDDHEDVDGDGTVEVEGDLDGDGVAEGGQESIEGDPDGDGMEEGAGETVPFEPDDGVTPLDHEIAAAEDLEAFAKGLTTIGSVLGGIATLAGVAALAPIATAVGVVGGSIWLASKGIQIVLKHQRDSKTDKFCPASNFSSGPAFATNNAGTPISTLEVMRQCTCDMVALAVAQSAPPGGGGPIRNPMDDLGLGNLMKSGFCNSSTENDKLKCLLNPFGPDDNIRRECRQSFKSDNGELNDEKVAERCNDLARCPDLHVRTWSVLSNGDIGCKCQMPDLHGVGGGVGDACASLRCEHGPPMPGAGGGECRCPVGPPGEGGGPQPGPDPVD